MTRREVLEWLYRSNGQAEEVFINEALFKLAQIEQAERLTVEEIEKILEDCKHSCPVCEGNGSVYADFRAHYPSEHAPTIKCCNCGGIGTVTNLDGLAQAIHQAQERKAGR